MRHPQVPIDGKKTISPSAASTLEPDDLLRILIAQVCPADPVPRQTESLSVEEIDEIVFDLECDGYRYLLIRSLKSSRAHVELSPREKEIVRMVAQGHPNKIIAGVLNISSWTVCTHLRRVFAKLGVGSRAAMVARLHDLGAIRSSSSQPQSAIFNAPSPNGPRKSDSAKPSHPSSKISDLPAVRRQSA